MIIIGLTGNSGSGKTAVSKILKDHLALIIDSDGIAHNLLATNQDAIDEVIRFFGREILDEGGHINRKILGSIVFNDQEKLDRLVSITHKYIIEEILEMINLNSQNPEYTYIVVDAPLLIEANLHEICNQVWLVTADEDIRLARVLRRDGISRENALGRFQKQTPVEQLVPYADRVIENNGSIADLEKEVLRLLKALPLQ